MGELGFQVVNFLLQRGDINGRFGLAGLKTYEPAVVATQQWYVGPGQQGEVMRHGYDQEYEDRLFNRIGWPEDGYRLFEIGHFLGGRDWLDGVWESNCMFVPRRQLEQVGGFEERFDMAGGGFANLELYERLGSAPDVTVATTAAPQEAERRAIEVLTGLVAALGGTGRG